MNNNDVRDREPIFSDRFDCIKMGKKTWDTIVETTLLIFILFLYASSLAQYELGLDPSVETRSPKS